MRETPSHAAPELLVPAGGPEALRAAVNNGADAVYLGLDRLNARRGAENFTPEALQEATRYAHLRGVRVYLAANVVIKCEEFAEALALVDEAWTVGVDAVIVQDIGFARILARQMPHVRLHASTQMNTHNTPTVIELVHLGFSRVTLARELSVSEIAHIVAASPIEVESFVHGALCICYSGQCLFSSAVGGRSANRGLCAQPCRLPYELVDDTGADRSRVDGRYLLSPKDLAGITALPRLVQAGVAALKIEGRMKSPEYVAIATGVYRAALDRAVADPEGFEVTEAEMSALAEAFSRGFTTGYLDGISDDRLMGYDRPNNRGVLVGRVASASPGSAVLALETTVEAGDTLEFWTRRGRFAQKVSALHVEGAERAVAIAGSKVTVRIDERVSAGDRVFRVVSAALHNAARRTYLLEESGRTVPVDVSVKAVEGAALEVTLETAGCKVTARGPQVEPARTKPLTAADITEHVGRLGNTPFTAASWDIELGSGVGAGFSQLHAVRRQATDALQDAILAPYSSRRSAAPTIPSESLGARRRHQEMPELVVWTTRPATARACLAAGAHRAIIPAWALAPEVEVPDGVEIEIGRVVKDDDVDCALAEAKPGRDVVVGNLGLLRLAAERGAHLWSHWSLNAVNVHTVTALAETGAQGVWLSPELSGREAAAIAADSPVPVGIAVLGRQELMVTEYCMLTAAGKCSKQCATCTRRERWWAMRDRKGYGFPVISDRDGRSHLFNAVPLDLTRAFPEIVQAGVGAVRLDFTVEHLQVAQRLTRQVREVLEAAIAGRASRTEPLLDPSTSGHFFRKMR
ncbi:MAG: U32 family peptidase [Coriobacteriia bacterium]|jgi:putative protease|nr:U32 family peptidase [Coriobacteriia bacterium]